jgi:hypothetical protein
MINHKYFIILFCNRRKKKVIHKSAKRSTIMDVWREIRTQKQPPYVKLNSGKKRTPLTYELALVYPNNRWAVKTYSKDELGRNFEVKMKDDKQRIKDIIPFWEEELIYDYESKKRIRYHQMMKYISTVTEIGQIFTLNNKLFVQVENDIRLFGNKNIDDTNRLFDIVREELIKKKKTNFIFVKDITTHQRTLLYNLLESKGYKRTELFRHYSY